MRKHEVCDVFDINRNTFNLWLRRRVETGGFKLKKGQASCKNRQITDINWVYFLEFVKANHDKTQEEVAEPWEEEISARFRSVRKIGFTKKIMVIVKEMKRNTKYFRKYWGDPEGK